MAPFRGSTKAGGRWGSRMARSPPDDDGKGAWVPQTSLLTRLVQVPRGKRDGYVQPRRRRDVPLRYSPRTLHSRHEGNYKRSRDATAWFLRTSLAGEEAAGHRSGSRWQAR